MIPQNEKITLDKVALWLGEKEINLKLAWEEIRELKAEIERLKNESKI